VRRPNRLSGVRRGWTPDAIEQSLRELIADADTWPTKRDFQAAGLASMLTSIYAHEGPGYWARRMGVKLLRWATGPRRTLWTEERIREGLERFCAGRELWPTEQDFVDAGQRNLYAAASRNGGVAQWARLLGLTRGRRPT
jgi:hypothetical protein